MLMGVRTAPGQTEFTRMRHRWHHGFWQVLVAKMLLHQFLVL